MNNALRFGGWLRSEIEERRVWVLLVVVVLAVLVSTYAYNVITKIENTFVEPAGEMIGFAPSGFQCPSNWTRTTGEDVEQGEGARVVSCTNGAIILTHVEGESPVAFDTRSGQFIDAGKYR